LKARVHAEGGRATSGSWGRDYGTARVGYISVPAHAPGQDKERKDRQDGQIHANIYFSREKRFHVDPVFLCRIGDPRFRSAGVPIKSTVAAGIVPEPDNSSPWLRLKSRNTRSRKLKRRTITDFAFCSLFVIG
jgi:hypothetical protein